MTLVSWRRKHEPRVIQVGQVLDKYELLERVGQGGMAVVYRGLDRSLKRVVAVKVLHKHLSDYQEARDRFEREAQAVAKLRHENILEIFDYSGAQTAEQLGSSYIVTEFIDGHTLKQVFTDRPIAFPEIGAMVILQVCRALAHAHSVGILHRDVKPENIMIRGDGVVKLMDFGISHMVDLERLTVTGQLLGSPAYMAPEHVEGRQLDFRTDVFAVGIVLYQLTVGKLPFEGKNPHEVLKRIAECRFVDPRQVNARIGNRLGRIILKAMAAQPDDRFASVGEMVLALEAYLEESGLPHDKAAAELGRYFQGPAAYETTLEDRLVDHLTRRGQTLLAQDDRAGALDIFDRVLTIDADNEKVIAILDGINRRTRIKAALAGVAMAAVIGTGAYMIHRRSLPPELEQPAGLGGGTPPHRAHATHVAQEDPPPIVEPVVTPAQDAGEPAGSGRPAVSPVDAPAVAARPAQFRVFPDKDAEYQIEKLGWRPVPDGGLVTLELTEVVSIQIRNRSGCCQDESLKLKPGDDTTVTTHFLPARITATCSNPTVRLSINNKPWRLGLGKDIPVDGSVDGSAKVTIEFLGDNIDSTPIVERVKFADQKEVQCVPR